MCRSICFDSYHTSDDQISQKACDCDAQIAMSSDVQLARRSLSLTPQHTSWQLRWRMNQRADIMMSATHRHTQTRTHIHRQGQAGLEEKPEPCLAAWCGREAVGWWPLSDRFAAFHSAPTLSTTGHFATENFSMSSKVWQCYGVAVAACCTTLQ